MTEKIYKIRLRKGDEIVVRSGKHKGKTGKVTAVHPKLNKVTVEGINVVKKAIKPSREHPQGAIVELTKPIWVSKVGAFDSTKKTPSRIVYKVSKDGKKSRVLKSSGKEMK